MRLVKTIEVLWKGRLGTPGTLQINWWPRQGQRVLLPTPVGEWEFYMVTCLNYRSGEFQVRKLGKARWVKRGDAGSTQWRCPMGRDDFEVEAATEFAHQVKHQVGVFQAEMFRRLPPPRHIHPRTSRIAGGCQPEANRAWLLLWEVHNRHPTWVARAMKLLLGFQNRDLPPVARGSLGWLHQGLSVQRIPCEGWLDLARETD